MSKFKFELFDADVGGNVHEETFDSSSSVISLVESVVDSYECDDEFADEQEIRENAVWNRTRIKRQLSEAIYSDFIDSISAWLPGHHRKIIINKIKE